MDSKFAVVSEYQGTKIRLISSNMAGKNFQELKLALV